MVMPIKMLTFFASTPNPLVLPPVCQDDGSGFTMVSGAQPLAQHCSYGWAQPAFGSAALNGVASMRT